MGPSAPQRHNTVPPRNVQCIGAVSSRSAHFLFIDVVRLLAAAMHHSTTSQSPIFDPCFATWENRWAHRLQETIRLQLLTGLLRPLPNPLPTPATACFIVTRYSAKPGISTSTSLPYVRRVVKLGPGVTKSSDMRTRRVGSTECSSLI